MIKSTKHHCFSWKARDFSFLPRFPAIKYKSYQTYPNVVKTAIGSGSAGVKLQKYDRVLKTNTPIGRRGICKALSSMKDVVVFIVAHGVIKINAFVRNYVQN